MKKLQKPPPNDDSIFSCLKKRKTISLSKNTFISKEKFLISLSLSNFFKNHSKVPFFKSAVLTQYRTLFT